MGFDTNPRDEETVDKEEYEKWEKNKEKPKLKLRVVITTGLIKIFECDSWYFEEGGIVIQRQVEGRNKFMAHVPDYLYFEDIADQESKEVVE